MALAEVVLYSDGACLGNPGAGGWATLLRYGEHERELSGGEAHTTNNRMELMAVIEGLKQLKKPCHVSIYSDSRYVIDGFTRYLAGWQKNGWKAANRQPVRNQDLWQQLIEATAPHRVTFHWVRGHSDDEDNNRVDKIAKQAAEKFSIKGNNIKI